MAFQAEIIVAFDEQLGVHRAVWMVTDGAAFAHGFVLKHEGLGLLTMAPGA